jgi:uncharacterized Tic20 family protein
MTNYSFETSTPNSSKEANQWGMFVHFGIFAGYIIPIAGLVVPLILWQIKKDEYPIVDRHGKVVSNWMLSAFIYSLICIPLTLVAIGILGFIAIGIVSIVFAIVGGIKANSGEVWEYPGSIKFFK